MWQEYIDGDKVKDRWNFLESYRQATHNEFNLKYIKYKSIIS